MGNPEIIAGLGIALIVGGAIAYIIKAKKSGKKCIGCPHGDKCKGSCNSCNCQSGCFEFDEKNESEEQSYGNE